MSKPPARPAIRSERSLRLLLLSDTHGLHAEVDPPESDILLHSGDVCMLADVSQIRSFDRWLSDLPYRHKILVPGNHDDPICKDRSLVSNATILIDQGVTIDGLRIWGCPGHAATGASVEKSKRAYGMIPDDVDVLITHGPPHGILDCPPGADYHAGDRLLREEVEQRIRPRVHVFGHIHVGAGIIAVGDTLFINAAMLGQYGDLERQPIVVRIPRA